MYWLLLLFCFFKDILWLYIVGMMCVKGRFFLHILHLANVILCTHTDDWNWTIWHQSILNIILLSSVPWKAGPFQWIICRLYSLICFDLFFLPWSKIWPHFLRQFQSFMSICLKKNYYNCMIVKSKILRKRQPRSMISV